MFENENISYLSLHCVLNWHLHVDAQIDATNTHGKDSLIRACTMNRVWFIYYMCSIATSHAISLVVHNYELLIFK